MWVIPILSGFKYQPSTNKDNIFRRTVSDTNFITGWVILAFLTFELTVYFFIMVRSLSFLPEHNFESSYINNVNASIYKDNDNSLIKIIAETDKSFFNTNIFLHTPFGLPVVKNSLDYSSNNKYYYNFLLMINYTDQVMPVRIFGLFGLHHGLEIELKSKVKESIQEEAFFDYKNRSYEIQSYSLTGTRRYINVRQIPNPGLYPSKKRLEILEAS